MTKKQHPERFRHSLRTSAGEGHASATVTAIEDAPGQETSGEVTLTAKTQRMIDEVREAMSTFSSAFTAFTVSRKKFAPTFMKAFQAYEREVGGPKIGNFIAFVRLIDPTVPAERDGYRKHSTYQAAENLRSLWLGINREDDEEESRGRRAVTPMHALARLVATMLPMVPDGDLIWGAFTRNLHWNEFQITRLKKMVETERALPLSNARLVKAAKRAPATKAS